MLSQFTKLNVRIKYIWRTNVTYFVEDSPVITCQNTTAVVGQHDVILSCTVRAQPAITTPGEVNWFHGGTNGTRLTDPSTAEYYSHVHSTVWASSASNRSLISELTLTVAILLETCDCIMLLIEQAVYHKIYSSICELRDCFVLSTWLDFQYGYMAVLFHDSDYSMSICPNTWRDSSQAIITNLF